MQRVTVKPAMPIADLSGQVAARLSKPKAKLARGDAGSDTHIVTTGSTLLDLAISGGRFAKGGIPAGILVKIFGPSGCGKTVLLCEIAGGIQRSGRGSHVPRPRGPAQPAICQAVWL